ncbi:hypothetical protein GCM10010377_10680 [Streptomyces viridiviolaceus]|uniref:Secreted protein n=1 Tax=Streptomyces viridiviolaceus TaxID=68282 RepID=A0ABW2E8U6_9ACTN|nr:hypothetical protein [Streptomyces viridiviolaceus]GHB22708.1 hypothetical protein GCM10010377_10680 [Streptomyces viridiviolaceus]
MGEGAGIRRRLALATAVLTVAGLLTVALPQDAQAAAYCPGRKVRTLPFSTGTVLVHKRGGYVCAVTVPEKPGTKRKMSVSVQARGGRPVVDEGRYAYRAGPVTVYAGQRCVWVKGAVARGSVSSGRILC